MGKRKGRKRLFPKKYLSETVRTRGRVDESKTVSYTIFQNHQRTESLGRLVPVRVKTGNPKFRGQIVYIQEPVPPTKQNYYVDKDKAGNEVHVRTPRGLTMDALRISKTEPTREFWSGAGTKGNDRMSGYTTWNFFRVPCHDGAELRLYFSQNQWIFAKMLASCCRYSITYKSKQLALLMHKQGRIFWAGTKPLVD